MSEQERGYNYDVRFPARRKLIWFLIISFSLFAIVFSAVKIENWRGRSAWMEFQQEAEAKGETFDILKLAPPQVPAESNFAGVPIFAKLFDYYRDSAGKTVWRNKKQMDENPFRFEATDSGIESPGLGYWAAGHKTDLTEWQAYYQKIQASNQRQTEPNAANEFPLPDVPGHPAGDVLLAFSKLDPALLQLREASARPYSRFPINYEDNALALLPHLSKLKSASQFLNLRASAELEAGQIENAAEDVVLNLRVANSLRGEPLLISHLVRIAMVSIALSPLWEGLDEQQWSDAQLQVFQGELRKFDFLESQQLAMRGERAFAKMVTDMLRTNRSEFVGITVGLSDMSSIKDYLKRTLEVAPYYMMPDGWFYQNHLTIGRLYETILSAVDPDSRRVYRSEIEKSGKAVEELFQGFRPYKMLASLLFPAVGKSVLKSSFQQTVIDLALLACALERHRLAHGTFPETLAELAPEFIDKIPHDIMNGEPLKYRCTDDKKFILYSVGWNETDDGGKVALTSTGRSIRTEEGDWVWQYSTNAAAAKPVEPGGNPF